MALMVRMALKGPLDYKVSQGIKGMLVYRAG